MLGLVRLGLLLVFKALSSILYLGLNFIKLLLFFALLLLAPTLELLVSYLSLLHVCFWIAFSRLV